MDGPEEATSESAWPEATLWPRFRGKIDKSGDKIFWESRTGTLHLPAPINTPAEQPRGEQRAVQDRVVPGLYFFQLL